jgi:hypothetical protein
VIAHQWDYPPTKLPPGRGTEGRGCNPRSGREEEKKQQHKKKPQSNGKLQMFLKKTQFGLSL